MAIDETPPGRSTSRSVPRWGTPRRIRTAAAADQGTPPGSRSSARRHPNPRRRLARGAGASFGSTQDLSAFYRRAGTTPSSPGSPPGPAGCCAPPRCSRTSSRRSAPRTAPGRATVRMVNALVAQLGERRRPATTRSERASRRRPRWRGRDEAFYREVVSAGVPGRRTCFTSRAGRRRRARSRDVRDGVRAELPDEEVEGDCSPPRRRALRGGAHDDDAGKGSRLILDSWTRPTYARQVGRKVPDAAIERRFRRYGDVRGPRLLAVRHEGLGRLTPRPGVPAQGLPAARRRILPRAPERPARVRPHGADPSSRGRDRRCTSDVRDEGVSWRFQPSYAAPAGSSLLAVGDPHPSSGSGRARHQHGRGLRRRTDARPITGTLAALPGLLVLIPAAVGMKGTIFGAIGARLGTANAAGVLEINPGARRRPAAGTSTSRSSRRSRRPCGSRSCRSSPRPRSDSRRSRCGDWRRSRSSAARSGRRWS